MYSRKRNFADVSTNLFRKRRSRVLQVFIVRDISENESSVEKYLILFAIEWITHLEKLRGNQRTNSKLKIVERFASGLRINGRCLAHVSSSAHFLYVTRLRLF